MEQGFFRLLHRKAHGNSMIMGKRETKGSCVVFAGALADVQQPEGFAKLACAIKEKSGKNIWCYTGYTFETLLRNPLQAKLLQYIDVLVDGKFKQELRDESLCFRGSKNQRLIDVQASLRTEEVVAYNYNPVPRIA